MINSEKKEDDKNISKEISTSTNVLTEKEEEEINNENNINNDSRITLEDLTNIIYEPDNNKVEEKHEDELNGIEKENKNNSKDEILENELSQIKKQRLSRYLMVDGRFVSTVNETEQLKNKIDPLKPKKFKLFKKEGRCLFAFIDRYGNPLLIIGPHIVMYVCFCGIISLIMLGIYLTLWNKLGYIMRILGNICFWTYFISYTHCSLINPGYPKNNLGRNYGSPNKDYYYCNLCHFYVRRDKFASHCFDCDICIENFDHHCPWTGHCIGKNNLYSFYIFIGFSFFIIIYLATAICIGALE